MLQTLLAYLDKHPEGWIFVVIIVMLVTDMVSEMVRGRR